MTTKVTIHQAKTNLSKLIKKAIKGESIVICHGSTPVVTLVPFQSEAKVPQPGFAKDLITKISADFDEPLDDFKDYR